MHPADIQAAVTGKVSCHTASASALLKWIVENRANGVSSAGEKHFVSQYAEDHDIGPDDVLLICEQADQFTQANGGSVAPKIWSAAELFSMEIEPPKWIIPDLLPAGLTILAGNPKAGKSWLAYDLAIAASTGGSLFGDLDCEQVCDVLYLALEDSSYRVKERGLKLLAGDPYPKRLGLTIEWPTTDDGGLDHLRQWCDSQSDPGLIIIDTLQKIRAPGTKNGSIYAEDYKAIGVLKKLADEYKIAVVVVHHLRKASSKDPFEKISGSYGLTGAADTNIVLERDPATSNASLHIRGRDVGDSEFALLFDKGLGRWQLFGECELPTTKLQLDIVAALMGKTLTTAEIIETVDAPSQSIKNSLPKLTKKLLVTKVGHGKYTSTTTFQDKNL